MDERYKRAKALFLAVCDLDPPQQAAHLDKECAHDPELRAEVESLLAHYGAPTAATATYRAALSPKDPADGTDRRRIGSYRVIRELGQGGMGVVYLGMRDDDQIRHRVAIKVLKRGMDTEQILHRFELERQLLAALNHPGIARLYDAGQTDDGLPYLVMEYVEGQPIDEYCDVHRLRIAERLELFRLVCAAVHYAHQNLIVHRDLKPDNIIVTSDGTPKLLDFGIAKILNPELSLIKGDPTAPEFRVMTPEYASPEQVRGYPITTGSDVYALGVLLYELMSGHRPYRLRSLVRAEIERAICEEEPEKPSTSVSRVESHEETDASKSTATITPESVSKVREGRPDRLRRRLAGDIDNIVLMAMRKEPQRRYVSAEQFSEDIRRHLDGLPVIAHGDSIRYRFTKFVRRHRAGVAAAAVIVLSLLGGIAATWSQARVAETERDTARQAESAEAEQRARAETERDRAETERATAERRFDQVRSLARTFMFDFHDAIQQLEGSVPARELLVTTAVEYLDRLAQEVSDNPELQRELAAGYDRVGDIRGGIRNPSRGNSVDALEQYRKANELREDLLRQSPDDEQLRLDVSSSYIRIGDILLNTGKTREALEDLEQGLEIRAVLASTNPDLRRGHAVALLTVGTALVQAGLVEEATAKYEQSLAIREQLAAEKPDDTLLQRDLGIAYARLASRRQKVGDLDSALDLYLKSVRTRERLAQAEPDNARFKRDLKLARYFLAGLYLSMGQHANTQAALGAAAQSAREQVRDNPGVPRYLLDLAVIEQRLGETYAAIDDWDAAQQAYDRYRATAAQLARGDPANTDYRVMIAGGYLLMGNAAYAAEDVQRAADLYRQGLDFAQKLVTNDPDDARALQSRGQLRLTLGRALQDQGADAEVQLQLLGARDDFTSLRNLQPQQVGIQQSLVETYQELSELMASLENGDAALAYANDAIRVAEERAPSLLRDLAVAHHLAGHRDLAIRTVEEALGLLEQAPKTQDVDELRSKLQADLKRYRNKAVSLKKASWQGGIVT